MLTRLHIEENIDASISSESEQPFLLVHLCFPLSALFVDVIKGHSMSNQHKKSLPPPIWMKIGSYTVSVETLIHSEFQHSMLYGFGVRAR